MNRILILFAHPALEKSRVQYRLAKAAQTLEGVHFHDLYQHYPDFMIDVEYEQALLRKHDIILFQHPLHWYSAPAILKEWQDLVLEYGFAYGSKGTALKDKLITNVISAGGARKAYSKEGHNRFTVRALLAPFEQTAYLCGMHYLPPFAVHATHRLSQADIDDQAEHYRQTLRRLQREIPAAETLESLQYLNDWPAADTATTGVN